MITIYQAGSLSAQKAQIRPESRQVALEERGGSVTWTADTALIGAVSVGDWARISSGPGSEIVWRVKEIRRAVETETATVTLEHLINALKDKVLADEVGPADMGGSSDSVSCRTAIVYALSWQSVWELWDFGFSGSAGFEFNGDTVFEAIETVCSTLEGAEWSYDFSHIPFRLSILPRETAVSAEMRMSRNITTMQTSVSRANMYTRFYPIGKNDLRLPEKYLSKNEGLYGAVAKVETDSSLSTEAQLRAWAWERLEKHAEPQVTVTISGLDYSESTGEPLDRLRIGKVCRVPLPEFGSTIVERITKLQWPDAEREPERVTVTMANTPEDLASIIKSDKASSAKSGRSGAKQAGEDHAWFVDTEDHVAMVAEAVAGPGAAQDWSRVSQILVDGEGIHQTVTKAVGDLITQQAQIDVNEERILQEVLDRTQEGQELRGAVEVAARKVSMVVKETKDGDVIDVAEICAEINESLGSVAWINASKVWIGNKRKYVDGVFDDYDVVIAGKASIAELDSARARISRLEADSITAIDLAAMSITVQGISSERGTASFYKIAARNAFEVAGVDCLSLPNGVKAVQIAGPTNNVYKLQYTTYAHPDTWTDAGNFSRATTLSGQWSGGQFSVNASPQGNSIRSALFDVAASDITWDDHWAGFYIYANLDGGETKYNTGKYIWIDATDEYEAGYEVKHSQFSRVSGPTSYDSNSGYSTAGKLNLGAISKSSINAPGYLAVRFSVHGHTEEAYITINN